MKQTEQTYTSKINLEGSSSAALPPISLLLLSQHMALLLAAWWCTVWAQSMRWEMSQGRRQTPSSLVPDSIFQHIWDQTWTTYRAAETSGVWHLSRAGSGVSCWWFIAGNCNQALRHTSSLSLSVVDCYSLICLNWNVSLQLFWLYLFTFCLFGWFWLKRSFSRASESRSGISMCLDYYIA